MTTDELMPKKIYDLLKGDQLTAAQKTILCESVFIGYLQERIGKPLPASSRDNANLRESRHGLRYQRRQAHDPFFIFFSQSTVSVLIPVTSDSFAPTSCRYTA